MNMPQGGFQAPGAQAQSQNPQQQAQAPVPDHRIDELSQRLRDMENQNNQLRGQINMMAQANQQGNPQQQQEVNPAFAPEVQQALDSLIQQRIQAAVDPLAGEVRQQIGMLYDKTDEVNYNLNYSGDRFKKFNDKVDRIRQEAQTRNQWLSREDALRIAYFEETGKKPVSEPPKTETQQTQPKFDPYFGTYVDENGNPIAPKDPFAEGQQQANQQNTQMNSQMPNQQGNPQQFQQQGQGQFPAQMPNQQIPGQAPQQQIPTGFEQPPQQNQFGLPQDMTTPQGNIPHQQTGHLELGIDSGDQELDAWADKYGDVPL